MHRDDCGKGSTRDIWLHVEYTRRIDGEGHVPRLRRSLRGQALYTANPACVHVANMRHSASNLVSKMRTGAVALIECRARFIQAVSVGDKQREAAEAIEPAYGKHNRVS